MWIFVPQVCRSAQESVAWTLPPAWSLELAECVSWRGKLRASSSWLRAWKKGGWIQRLFGRMCAPSMAARGVAEWISSLPATPVSPSAMPEKVSLISTRATSGLTSGASSESRVQLLLFSKTSKDTCGEDSTPFSMTLTASGSMRNGACIPQPKQELLTAGTGSSFWPTAVAGDSKSCGAAGYSTASGRHHGTTLTDAARQWKEPGGQLWWGAQSGPLDRTNPGKVCSQFIGRQLNADFVEWLMGFPAGWTVCEHSETLSAHSKQLWHCGISAGGSSDG